MVDLKNKDLANLFTYHPPTDSKIAKHELVREYLLEAAETLNGLLPESDEKSVALDKLQEAMFWSNAAIARH